jgi:hypothetical protein
MATTPNPKQQIIARFPAFAGLFGTDQERAALVAEFGQDLVDLLLDVVNNPKNYDLTTTDGIKAFDAQVSATSYVVNTDRTRREFELLSPADQEAKIKLRVEQLAADYGQLALNQNELRALAITAEKGGFKAGSISEQHLLYSSKSGTKVLGTTSQADALKKIARDYNYKPSNLDEMVDSILTGKPGKDGVVLTEDSLRQAAKAQAMAMYPHLKMQLDNGSTLSDVFGTYRSAAANLLEVPEDQISMSDPLYADALGTSDSGPMSLSAWTAKVKSDRRYGYQYTKQANQDAVDLGSLISRAFGARQ